MSNPNQPTQLPAGWTPGISEISMSSSKNTEISMSPSTVIPNGSPATNSSDIQAATVVAAPNYAQKTEPEQSSPLGGLPGIDFTPAKPQNITVVRPTIKPGEINILDRISLPPASSTTHTELARRFPSLRELTGTDRQWAATYLESLWSAPANDALQGSLSRDNSDWRQGIEVNGELINSKVPHYNKPVNAVVSGEQALQMAYVHMGIGDIFTAAMYNSGFWVTFKPAPDTVWLHINRLLGADVIKICRETYGLLHSTATSLTIATIIDAIIPYVYATSVNPAEMPVSEIPLHLKTTDEHDFIWGFICANYPRGFNIDRSCIANPSTCRTVIKEVIQPAELQIVDNTAIPEYCRNHMRQRNTGSMSIKSVKEYQERLDASLGSVVHIGKDESIELHLRAPSSQVKRGMTENYVESIKAAVLASVTNDMPPQARERLYDEYSTANEMRLYQHWVSKLVFGGNTVDKPEDIANILGVWSRDSELSAQFFDKMSKYIDSCAVSVIGLEAVKCPNCGGDHSNPDQRMRGKIDYVPLDIVQVFSFLAEFKTRVISARM